VSKNQQVRGSNPRAGSRQPYGVLKNRSFFIVGLGLFSSFSAQ